MSILIQFTIGLIFSAGLMLAGMTDPAKVQNFLDLAGQWDASLAFVMAGAIAVTFIGFKLVLKRKAPVFGGQFHLPTRNDADRRLILGSAIFGVGWGLAGLCPGPAIASLGIGSSASLIFVAAMLAGMAAARQFPAPSTGASHGRHSPAR